MNSVHADAPQRAVRAMLDRGGEYLVTFNDEHKAIAVAQFVRRRGILCLRPMKLYGATARRAVRAAVVAETG